MDASRMSEQCASLGLTPSQQAKAAGLKSLTEASELTGASLQTLTNWHRDKPELFHVVISGCVSMQKGENQK